MIEVNLISFITLIATTGKRVCMLYFVVQRVGSLMVLARGLFEERNFVHKYSVVGLLLKAGMSPFHF